MSLPSFSSTAASFSGFFLPSNRASLKTCVACSALVTISSFVILAAGRYFDEISQDTGKYCFGVEDTLKALEMGAVEILIVYENLDIMRYVLHCQGTEGR